MALQDLIDKSDELKDAGDQFTQLTELEENLSKKLERVIVDKQVVLTKILALQVELGQIVIDPQNPTGKPQP